jgi:hypothetical protein
VKPKSDLLMINPSQATVASDATIRDLVAHLTESPSRAPGTCDRHADLGKPGVPAIGLAVPPAGHEDWPMFRVCGPCGHRLACPFHGHGYNILPLAPGVQ